MITDEVFESGPERPTFQISIFPTLEMDKVETGRTGFLGLLISSLSRFTKLGKEAN